LGNGDAPRDLKLSGSDQNCPKGVSPRFVHLQQVHSRATNGAIPDDFCPGQREVVRPHVASRVEELHNQASFGIDGGKVRTFAKVAAITSERKVFRIIASTVLARPYMLDVERGAYRRLRKATVLAPESGATSHHPARPSVHYEGCRARERRALALRMPTKSIPSTYS
jgi:hypothetical protein